MVELSVSETTLPEVLAAIAEGQPVMLTDSGNEVALVSPCETRPETDRASLPSFAEAMADFKSRHNVAAIGVTDDEVRSWRDRSPGREPPF